MARTRRPDKPNRARAKGTAKRAPARKAQKARAKTQEPPKSPRRRRKTLVGGGIPVAWGSASIKGPRAVNEDAVGADPRRGVFVVCDGVGRVPNGRAAAKAAVAAFLRHARPDRKALHAAMAKANAAARRAKGATTLTGLVIHPAGGAYVAHVGDSRAYILPSWEDATTRVTIDHAEGRTLRRQLGGPGDERGDVEIVRDATAGATYLLCSDGLWQAVRWTAVDRALERARVRSPRVVAEELVKEAAKGRLVDNTTALVVRVGPVLARGAQRPQSRGQARGDEPMMPFGFLR